MNRYNEYQRQEVYNEMFAKFREAHRYYTHVRKASAWRTSERARAQACLYEVEQLALDLADIDYKLAKDSWAELRQVTYQQLCSRCEIWQHMVRDLALNYNDLKSYERERRVSGIHDVWDAIAQRVGNLEQLYKHSYATHARATEA